MVMGANVQVCWEKFCRYWEVEPRLVPMEGEQYHMTAAGALAHCDENTIGVVAVLGSTFDGSYEPIADICSTLDRHQAETGLDVPVHVDAASGGFVAPFIDPDLEWDFRLPRVQSINASGHKFGLVYPGVGWAVWRDPDALPDDLVFHVNYLGGDMPTFALNFSRPGNQVAAQYYNFIRLGFDGYKRVQQTSRDVALYTSDAISKLGPFRLLTDGSELPVFAFALDGAADRPYTVFDVSERLRDRGWLVPAYTFPENRQDLAALRIVVRNGMSRDLADLLIADLRRHVDYLENMPAHLPQPEHRHGFHH
jgi:glutamate decarboxylase